MISRRLIHEEAVAELSGFSGRRIACIARQRAWPTDRRADRGACRSFRKGVHAARRLHGRLQRRSRSDMRGCRRHRCEGAHQVEGGWVGYSCAAVRQILPAKPPAAVTAGITDQLRSVRPGAALDCKPCSAAPAPAKCPRFILALDGVADAQAAHAIFADMTGRPAKAWRRVR
jgi:hypothetical protein